MNDLLPTIAKCYMNGITLEICQGEIPDIFRRLRFNTITEFELPDTKDTDKEFNDWLNLYRGSGGWFERELLRESQCN